MRKSKPLDAAGLFDYALRLLAGRAMTQGELRVRLARRAANAADVAPALARLKEYGMLDDRRFAEAFTRLRLEDERYGRFRVLRDLKARRVAPALAEQAVGAAYRGVDEDRLVEEYLAKKLRRARPKELTPSRLASLYRSLLRAGFGAGAIRRALGKLSVPAEGVEESEDATDS